MRLKDRVLKAPNGTRVIEVVSFDGFVASAFGCKAVLSTFMVNKIKEDSDLSFRVALAGWVDLDQLSEVDRSWLRNVARELLKGKEGRKTRKHFFN